MNAPAATVRDPADLLHVDVDHVTGSLGNDALRFAVCLAGRVDEPPVAQSEMPQQSSHGPAAEADPFPLKLKSDARCRPFVLAAQPLDPPDDRTRRGGRLPQWRRGAVEQTLVAEGSVPIDPFRGRGTR